MASRSIKNGIRKREHKPTRHSRKRSYPENDSKPVSSNNKHVVMSIAVLLALLAILFLLGLGLFLSRGSIQNEPTGVVQADAESRNSKEIKQSKSNTPREKKLQEEARNGKLMVKGN